MSISSDVQKLDPGATIEMYVIDTSMLVNGSSTPLYLHPGANQIKTPVVWQAKSYTPFPIAIDGFEWNGSGSLPRPTVQVANVNGMISGLLIDMNDLVGARFTRKRTMVKYLDAENFTSGVNDAADPDAHFPDEMWVFRRKSKENKLTVEFELGATWDIEGFMLPSWQIIPNVCKWKYKGAQCGYAPGPMFKADDTPTTDPAQDVCGKRDTSCKLRFVDQELPYGGFPGSGLLQ